MSVALFTGNDIRDPQVWDKLKDQLTIDDKRNFLSLYHFETDDPLLRCRKAELHIFLGTDEDDAIAYNLLEDNPEPLALGLKARLYTVTSQKSKLLHLQKLGFPICKTIHDFEGALIFERALSSQYNKDGQYQKTLEHAYAAKGIAKSLGLTYMLKVIASNLKDTKRHLNIQSDNEPIITGNSLLTKHDQLATFRTALVEGEYQKIDSFGFSEPFKNLALAVEAKQKTRYSYALLLASKLEFDDPELQLQTELLKLELFGRTNDELYTQPAQCLRKIKGILSTIPNPLEPLMDGAKLYPLGIAMANLNAELAILRNERYRDGVHYQGDIHVIPKHVRYTLIKDDLENSNLSRLITKQERHRTNVKLRPLELNMHNLVSQPLIDRSKEQLRKFL